MDFAFEVDGQGNPRLSVDGKEVIEEALFLAASDAARELPAGRYRLTPIQTAQGGPLELFLDTGADKTLKYDSDAGLSSTEGDP